MRDDKLREFEFGPSHPVSARPVTRRLRPLGVVLLLALVLLGAVAYVYFVQPEIARPWLQGTPLEPSASVTTVYKWQDAQGNWQLTDRPPPAGIQYRTIEYRGDTNVMPLVPRED